MISSEISKQSPTSQVSFSVLQQLVRQTLPTENRLSVFVGCNSSSILPTSQRVKVSLLVASSVVASGVASA